EIGEDVSVRRAERGGRTGTTTSAPRDGGTGTAIPAPRDALGFTPGEARKLPSWPDVVGYFDTLAGASDRVRFDDLGPATEGQPFVLVTIAAPDVLADLDRYKEIQRRLADP